MPAHPWFTPNHPFAPVPVPTRLSPILTALMVGIGLSTLVGRSAERTMVLEEDFTQSPTDRGWSITGDTTLFAWDAGAGNLQVTWDSARPNSFFHWPLKTFLTRADDFSLAFDLTLEEITPGTTEGKPAMFEIALGLLNLAEASQPGYLRGTGTSSPNLFEWDYFPDTGFGATVATTLISTNHQWATQFNTPVEVVPGQHHRFELVYRADRRTVRTWFTRDGTRTELRAVQLPAEFTDFAVDTLSITSYSDEGQDPAFAGSVRALGRVDHLRLELPAPPVRRFTGGWVADRWEAEFSGWIGWEYTLEVSSDLQAWRSTGSPVRGTGHRQRLVDPTPSGPRGFYRLRAQAL